MQIDVAATAMCRREVEDQVDALDSTPGFGLLMQIGFDELDCAAVDMPLNIGEATAAEIVHNANLCPTLQQRIDQMINHLRTIEQLQQAGRELRGK